MPASAAGAVVSYTATPIGPAGWYVETHGVSDNGIVVGYAAKGLHRRALIWRDGTARDLPQLQHGQGALALGISSGGAFIAGTVVVGTGPDDGLSHAVLWHDGKVADLGTLGGGFSDGYAVNNRGVVVGESGTGNCRDGSGCGHAVRWGRHAHRIQDLGTLPGDTISSASAINDSGVIVGVSYSRNGAGHPVYWTHGRIHRLPTLGHLGAAEENEASGINDRGVIAGAVSTGRATHAAIWKVGKLVDLGHGATTSTAAAINSHGVVVGDTIERVHGDLVFQLVRWTPSHRLVRIQPLVTTPGWSALDQVGSLNDKGWLVGGGTFRGAERAVLLLPVKGPRSS